MLGVKTYLMFHICTKCQVILIIDRLLYRLNIKVHQQKELQQVRIFYTLYVILELFWLGSRGRGILHNRSGQLVHIMQLIHVYCGMPDERVFTVPLFDSNTKFGLGRPKIHHSAVPPTQHVKERHTRIGFHMITYFCYNTSFSNDNYSFHRPLRSKAIGQTDCNIVIICADMIYWPTQADYSGFRYSSLSMKENLMVCQLSMSVISATNAFYLHPCQLYQNSSIY